MSFFNNADKVNTNIKYYLTTISKNMALNYIKKTSKLTYLDDDTLLSIIDSSIKEENKNDDFLYVLSLLKSKLTPHEYAILCMHLLDNYTFKNISTKLNMKESTIKTLYYRTIKKSRLIIERRKDNEKR